MRDEHAALLRVTVDGRAVDVADGSTVAAALVISAGIGGTRLSASGMPRAAIDRHAAFLADAHAAQRRARHAARR